MLLMNFILHLATRALTLYKSHKRIKQKITSAIEKHNRETKSFRHLFVLIKPVTEKKKLRHIYK